MKVRTASQILNHETWASAIRQRYELDLLALKEGRAHQMVDPETSPGNPPGPGYKMTSWVKFWIDQNIQLTLQDRALQLEKAQQILSVPTKDHESQVLSDEALRLFGASHEEAKEELKKKLKGFKGSKSEKAALEDQIAYVDRHVETVKISVHENRQRAEVQVAEYEALTSEPYDQMLARVTEEVHAALKAAASEPEVAPVPEKPKRAVRRR